MTWSGEGCLVCSLAKSGAESATPADHLVAWSLVMGAALVAMSRGNFRHTLQTACAAHRPIMAIQLAELASCNEALTYDRQLEYLGVAAMGSSTSTSAAPAPATPPRRQFDA